FYMSFGLLQNSISLVEFERYLFHIYVVFCQPKINNQVITSLKHLKESVEHRDFFKKIYSSEEQNESYSYVNDDSVIIDIDDNKICKNQSPYTFHFDNVIKSFNNKLTNKGDTAQKNEYFCPDLFKQIQN